MSNYSTAITRNADDASKLLKAIANSNRLMILCQLKVLGERNVNQLLANLSISQPALSQPVLPFIIPSVMKSSVMS